MKDFLKYVLANFVALAIVGGACAVLFFLFLSAVLVSGSPQVQVPATSVLVYNLSMPITDKPVTEDFGTFLGDMQGRPVHTMDLHTALEALKAAGDDDRIAAMYLTGNVMNTSWANLTELRKAIADFRAKGKPVIAYNQYMREVDYYAASAADMVLLHPNGVMEFNGFASQIMFWKGAFDKYGVDVQVTRVGKYKSAVEPYLMDKMSDANREQVEGMLGDLFGHFVAEVADTRGLLPDNLKALADSQTLLQPQEALDAGLIDGLEHYDQVLARLGAHVGGDTGPNFRKQISLRKYAEARALTARPESSDNRVAVIYAEGQIVDGSSREELGGDDLAQLLRRARLDKKVKAVVLRVNSPGGSATASEVIGREVRLLLAEKPVVVSMGAYAASGGYWISSHATEVFAQPNTLTGSIGVFGMFTNFKDLMNHHGLTVDVAKTSPMADALTAFRPKTEAELASLQMMVDNTYDTFLDLVAEGRHMEREKVQEIAQGRVWSGSRALELGLVDKLGGLQDAFDAAVAAANLTDYQWYQYQQPKTFAEEFVEILEDKEHYIAGPPAGPMEQTMRSMQQTWKTLSLFDGAHTSYALLPFTFSYQ